MGAVILVMVITFAAMWGFFKFMYPKPPQSLMPKKGDVITPRTCNFCHNQLAEYRGVLEPTDHSETPLFFCNYEHQADYHAGKTYQP